ncbi:putative metallodependent hydrolase [Salmonella enterica subsp. arizonae]|nr:putative metallodependent hydrolase [Salmonella enterica subsp. arizonae]
MFLVDSHCHLDGLDYQSLHKDVDDVLAKAAARDVKFCLAVATTLPGYRHMRELVGKRDNVVFSCGVHPLNQDEAYDVEALRLLAAEDDVVAMGETGLDYFYTPETKVRQQASFIHHIQIGRELKKPVIVHTRDARADTLAILREEKGDGLRRRTTLFYRRQRNGRQIAGSGILYLFFRHRNVP